MSDLQSPQLTKKDFESDQAVRWCPGCGDYAVLAQAQKNMIHLDANGKNLFLFPGSGVLADFPII